MYTKDNGTHTGLASTKCGRTDALSSVRPTLGEAKVLSVLKRLKRKSAGDVDGIPAIFHKECAPNLLHPLARLFQIGFDYSAIC